jgi:TctA family transporter
MEQIQEQKAQIQGTRMFKYIIGGCALGIILGSLPIGLGAAFALYFWRNTK